MKTIKNLLLLAVFFAVSTPAALAQSDWTFDGGKLGQGFSEEFVRNTHFVQPCEMDPINDETRSVVFFTAKPCRGPGMTEGTTIVLFTSPAITSNTPNAAVTTIAWMGGTYMNSRSDFPVRIGATEAEAIAQLGEISETLTKRRGNKIIKISKHSDQNYSLIMAGKVVGLITGDMPKIDFDDESREEWQAVLAGLLEFTPLQN